MSAHQTIDFDAIRRAHALPAIVQRDVKLTQAGGEWKGCCPFHVDGSPSFTIFAGGARFHCFGCGANGDVIDYVRRQFSVGVSEAVEMLGGANLPATELRQSAAPAKGERVDEAKAIWRGAVAVAGSLAESYLRYRALTLRIPESIRFARLPYGKPGATYPCLVACIASVDNRLVGIQRTYLNAAGTGKAAVPKPKLSLGMVRGCAIRLAPAARELVVCEGLEDGLSLMQELGKAVWVAGGASMLPAMQFPPGVQSVVIGADGDAPGEIAAQKAAEAFRARGLAVRVIRPLEGFKDYNDELRGRV